MTESSTVQQRHIQRIEPSRRWLAGIVRYATGGLLVIAAGLKLYFYLKAPPSDRWWIIVQVEAEWLLGAWLVLGIHRRAVWMLATVTFATFSIVSLWKALSGEQSCGCFGQWEVSPWVTFGVDALLTTALVVCRKYLSAREAPSITPKILTWIVPCVGLILLLVTAMRPTTGLSEQGKAAVRMTSAPESPKEILRVDLGYVPAKGERELEFVIANPTDSVLEFAKIESECGCVKFPQHLDPIGPRQSATIRTGFHAPDIHEPYAKRTVLFPTGNKMAPIVLEVSARVGLPLKSEPTQITVSPGQHEVQFVVTNDSKSPVKLLYSICNDEKLSVATPRDAVPANGSSILKLKIASDKLMETGGTEFIRLHSDSPDQPVLEMPVVGLDKP